MHLDSLRVLIYVTTGQCNMCVAVVDRGTVVCWAVHLHNLRVLIYVTTGQCNMCVAVVDRGTVVY